MKIHNTLTIINHTEDDLEIISSVRLHTPGKLGEGVWMTDKDCQTASAGNEKAISLDGWQRYKGTITEPKCDTFICCLFKNTTIKLTVDYFSCESSDSLKTSALRECTRRRTALKARWPCCVVLRQHLHGDAPEMLSKTSCSFQSPLGFQWGKKKRLRI